MPVGPSILWPLKARKSAPSSRTFVVQVRHALGGVDEHQRAGCVGAVGRFRESGLIVPSTFETEATATIFVRSVSSVSSASRIKRPSSVIGMCLRTAPVRSASCCQGTRFEWCSIVVTRISSPRFDVGVAPAAGDEVDAGSGAGGEDDFAGCRRR